MRDDQKRGQKLLIVVFGMLLLSVLGVPATAVVLQGPEVIKSFFFRIAMANTLYVMAILATLSYLMWIGKSWAKWLVILFMFMTALITLARLDEVSRNMFITIVVAMLLCFAISLFLALSKDIASFIRYKQMKRKGATLRR